MAACSYAGSLRPRSAATLDAAPPTRDLAVSICEGVPMGWWAIVIIALFVVGIGALNRIEFGRFD
jgi:hypothetical protein